MIAKILKSFTDFVYGTNRRKRKFLKDNPSERVLASDASKGIVTPINKEIERGLDWVTSQRAVVLLTEKRLISGRWTIPLDTIENARLFKINSILGGGQVLKVITKDGSNYQFGMQFNPEWTNQRVLPLFLEKSPVKYSIFSIAVRVILVLYILHWIYERYFS